MDRIIQQKKGLSKKSIYTLLIFSFVLAAILYTVFRSQVKATVFEKDRLQIAEVKLGEFSEYIPVEGIVVPRKMIFLDATEGGRVAEKFVSDGEILKMNQPILRLENSDLKLELLNKETQALDLINSLQNTRLTFENNRINRLSQLADIDFQLAEARRIFDLNSLLLKDKVISEHEYLQSKNQYDYQLNKKAIVKKAAWFDSLTADGQIRQYKESHAQMQKNLLVMRQKQNELLLTAPANGQLNNFRTEIGELKTKGQHLGQLDMNDGYKIRAFIDEHFLSRVMNGQKAEFEYNGSLFKLTLKAIFPQVSNGRFEAELEFDDKVPEIITKGQSLQVKLKLGTQAMAILLPKGAYYQQTGGRWIYLLDQDGKSAFKKAIITARQNPLYFEITEGLKPGDRVIVSSYQHLGEYNIIHFK